MLKPAIKDNFHFKWTPESTNVLVSIWTDCQVQHDLQHADFPSVVWDKISRTMGERGYIISSKQCRTRMMEVLVCYREARRADNGIGVEQHFKILERVMRGKNLDQDLIEIDVDTVDSTANYEKSPVKDMKINVPKKVRQKVLKIRLPAPQQPIFQTMALSPTWTRGHECVNSDSPESNETVITKPHRMFTSPSSPARRIPVKVKNDVGMKSVRRSEPEHIMYPLAEEAMREEYRPKFLYRTPYPYDEVFYQNSVQNAQNHIIQENMQQNIQQNLVGSCRNHLPQQNEHSLNQQHFPNGGMDSNMPNILCGCCEDLTRHLQNQTRRDFCKASLFHQHSTKCPKTVAPRQACVTRGVQVDLSSQNCSLDATQDLNDAFYQSDDEASYPDVPLHQRVPLEGLMQTKHDATILTNNATCNESQLEESIETEEKLHRKVSNLKRNVPFRKTKGKVSQMLLEAIKTQTETFSKVIAAQTNMMAQVFDEDKGRRNRLENKLDHLLSTFSPPPLQPSSPSSSLEPELISLYPPPKPGMIPPKLDLVPPKPCRVPCTIPNTNIELINQNPIQTKPGVISPIVTNSPNKKPGTIWSKLGPVSMSPFIKAQKRLGFDFVSKNNTCTQSSAERRINKELHEFYTDAQCSKYSTATELPPADRQLEEHIVQIGQWIEREINQEDKNFCRKLFEQQKPTVPVYITKITNAFLNAERHVYDYDPPYRGSWKLRMQTLNCARQDNLLTGQGESYERMSELNAAARRAYLGCEPCDTSTPARIPFKNIDEVDIAHKEGRIIKQVAHSVMNNAKWRDSAPQNQQHKSIPCTATTAAQTVNQNAPDIEYKRTTTVPKTNTVLEEELREFVNAYKTAREKPNKYKYNEVASDDRLQQIDSRGQPKFPMGFTTDMLTTNDQKDTLPRQMKDADRPRFKLDDKQLIDLKNNRIPFVFASVDNALPDDLSRQIFQKMYSAGLLPDLQLQYERDDVEKKTIKEDSINEEEYLDTTTTMHATCVTLKDSQTSDNMASAEIACSSKQSKANTNNNCVIT